jgi:hypothetical protein
MVFRDEKMVLYRIEWYTAWETRFGEFVQNTQ